MSRCSAGLVDGIKDGLIIGFVVGASLSFFRSCQRRVLNTMVEEGIRWASSGAIIFGALSAIKHCL